MPYLMFLLVCAIWGASFILMKKASLVFRPISIGVWRVAGGAAVLIAIAYWQRREWRVDRAHFWPLALAALISYAWPYTIQPYLVPLHGSGFIALTVSFTPLITVLVGMPMLGVYPTRRQLVGILGGLVCLGLIMADGVSRSVPWYDLLLAVSVPLCYAIGNSIIRLKLTAMSPLTLTASALGMTSFVLVPLAVALPSESFRDGYATSSTLSVAIASAMILGVLGTGVATYLFNRLIVEQGPLFAGMVTYIVPIGALMWGWLDTEEVTMLQITALVGVLAMVAVVQYGAAVPNAKGEIKDSPALLHVADEVV